MMSGSSLWPHSLQLGNGAWAAQHSSHHWILEDGEKGSDCSSLSIGQNSWVQDARQLQLGFNRLTIR